MYQYKYVFSQLIAFLDRNHFNYLVRKYARDKYVKHFTCWNQLLTLMFGCERSKNAHIERKKSKINYNLSECPTAEQIAEVERKMNELIAMDLPVTYEFVTRDNILEGVKLDKLPEDASETLRLVRIGDYDICPCIGKHVESTKEIGTFKITSTSFNDGSFRIVFMVNTEKQ